MLIGGKSRINYIWLMRNIFLLWLFFCLFCKVGFAQFSDNFSDLNFTQNPTWGGQDTHFVIDTTQQQLRLFAPAVSATSFLSTTSNAIYNTTWEFKVKLDFNPSSSNLARIYLVSDVQNLSNNGYFVMVGNTSDEVSLYRQNGGSISKIIDGADGLVNVSVPEVLIRVTRDSMANWQLFSDTTLTTNYTLEGTVSDSTHSVANYFGVQCIYTSTRSDKFYFDDFIVLGTAIPDLTAPTFDSLQITSPNSLRLFFNEPLGLVGASNTGNFSVSSGIGNPTQAQLTGAINNQVDLTFAQNFPINQNLQITVNNIADTSGNTINNQTKSFIRLQLNLPQYRDVVINEFMADPSPPANLPDKEFIELWNFSNKTFNLQNWQIGDNSNLRSLPYYIFAPYTFVIVCNINDTADFLPYGAVIGVPSLPALNNTSDQIRLKSDSGLVVDSIEYFDSWYNDDLKKDGGFSLALISPNDDCKTDQQNYTASTSPDGGTPGALNLVFDTLPNPLGPKITQVNLFSDSLILNFDASIDSTSIFLADFLGSDIQFSVTDVNYPANNQIILTANTPLITGNLYTLYISGLRDCYGIAMNDTAIEIGNGKIPQPFDLVINEIYNIPDASISPNLPEVEYVEIYNTTGSLLHLGSLFFSDLTTNSRLPDENLMPGEYAILVKNSDAFEFEGFGKVIGLNSWPSLNNTSDELKLTNLFGQIIHQVAYNNQWFNDETKAGGGFSLEQIDPNNPCGGQVNWSASNDISGGTPGIENSINGVFEDNTPPEILMVNAINNQTILVSFNEQLAENASTTVQINLSPQVTIDSISTLNATTLRIKLNTQLATKTAYSINLNNVNDCVQNTANNLTATFGLPEPEEDGDVLINEILFNPRPSNGSDYVELYNNSDKYINLQHWRFANWNTTDDTLGSITDITGQPLTLSPKTYIVFSRNSQELLVEYPQSNRTNMFEVNSLPSFPNNEGTVLILNQDFSIIDRLDYTEDMHLDFIYDYNGVALERISFDVPTQTISNWTSAAETENFGTPGYQNSAQNNNTNSTEVLSVSPEIFSPDNDGFNDVLNINYNMPIAGYAGKMTVYNPRGIKIIELVNNFLLGTTGTISWGGQTENGLKAEIGIYIIVLEVYNDQGLTEVYKTTAVLGGKI